jgi:signal transduction histidine kinase
MGAGAVWANDLSANWRVYWDQGGTLTAQEMMKPDVQWQTDTRRGNYGYRPGVLWLRFEMPATPANSGQRWLALGQPYIDRFDVYAQGSTQPFATLGDSVSPPPAPVYPTRHLVQLPASDLSQVWLLRVQTTSAMNISARLLQEGDLAQSMPRELFIAGMFMTLYLLSASLYAVSALVLRQPVQLAYSFYMVCLLAIFLGTQQPLLLNATMGSYAWANWVTGFGILMAPAAGSLLWIVILDLRRTHPICFKAYACIIPVCSVSLFTINTPFYRVAALCAVLGILVLGVASIALALWTMRQPEHRIRLGLYVLAFVVTVATAMALNLSVASVIPPQPWFNLAFDLSALLHVLLLGIASSWSVRDMQRQGRDARFRQRLLADQQAQIRSFSAFVAHELLTPLARIGRSAEMVLRESKLAPKTLRRITDMRESAFESGKLVEVFLNNAALQSGQAQVRPVSIDLSTWMPDVQTEFTLNYPQAVLKMSWPDKAPPVVLDPLLTKLSLENIVINALKYAGPQYPVSIQVAVLPGSVLFIVEDEGPGLNPEQYLLLGESALLRQPTEDKPGFGLGLSLVAYIAKAHGGSLQAQPRQPQGVRWLLQLGQGQTTGAHLPAASSGASGERPGTNA